MTPVMSRLLVVALLAWVSCAPPGEKQCEKACLHYSKLYLDEHWAERLAEASTDAERTRLERDKAAEWEEIKTDPERGLQACVAACDRPARQGAVDCILKAETLVEAKACNE